MTKSTKQQIRNLNEAFNYNKKYNSVAAEYFAAVLVKACAKRLDEIRESGALGTNLLVLADTKVATEWDKVWNIRVRAIAYKG